MSPVTDFMAAVMASVIGHYICKWLDRRRKGN